MKEQNAHPPKLFLRFFRWYCHPKMVDYIEGDLMEVFERRLKKLGKAKADALFIVDVLLLFRPGIIRLLLEYQPITHHGMLKSYFKTSVRSIVRNRLFSMINIVGLATSMSAGLLLITIVYDMFQYDKFHLNKNNIYRVIDDYEDSNGNSYAMATTSVKAGREIREGITGVNDVVLLQHGFSGDFQTHEKTLPLKGFWTEPSFFKIFSFDLIKGSPATALKEPHSIVLTETAAQKFFGNTDVLGKSIAFENDTANTFIVTGVLRDLPEFSHLKFEALGSFSTLDFVDQANVSHPDWENIWSTYVYVLLAEGTSPEELQTQLDQLSEKENGLSEDMKVYLQLQPMTEIALGKSLENQAGPVMSLKLVWFLTGISIIVLISACFNYTNLSIARSIKRSREIGIRKIAGAKKYQVLIQFIVEGVIVSLISLALALCIFQVIRPLFISLSPHLAKLLILDLTPLVITLFIMFALVTGFLAGLVPGLFYIQVKALTIVKKVSSMKLIGNLTLRKFLLVTQYSFSLIFMTSVVILYSQYKYFISSDLGFSTKDIVNIRLQDVKHEILTKNLGELASVTETSKSFMITSVGNNYYTHVKYANPQDSLRAWYNKIDEHYIPLFNFKLIAGRNFSKRNEGAESEVIVNEKLITQLNIRNGKPQDALGEIVSIEGKDLQIVGVLSDFHYSTLDRKIGPFLFRYTENNFNYVNVKLAARDLPTVMLQLDDAWKKTGSAHPFQAYFYEDMIQRAYNEYASMIKVIGYLATLAIVIATLGLVGMVVYATEARLFEIGIRKVFGARVFQLVFTLGKSFVALIIISGLVAIPSTYLFFDEIVLADIAYRSQVRFFELTVGYLGIMLIALLVIGLQTLKVAVVNPVNTLRNE